MAAMPGSCPAGFSTYTPGLPSRTFSAKAIAAIGQPLLGDGVLAASRDVLLQMIFILIYNDVTPFCYLAIADFFLNYDFD